MWRLFRRRTPLRPPGPTAGNGRERAAIEALVRTARAAAVTDELTERGELLAEHVRRALGGLR
jgi:hypothetical protein